MFFAIASEQQLHTPAPLILGGELNFDLNVLPEFEVLTQ
jgi:hypothetical protein